MKVSLQNFEPLNKVVVLSNIQLVPNLLYLFHWIPPFTKYTAVILLV